MGMGPGPVQVPNNSLVLCTNVHTDLRRGQGPRPNVYYCESPSPCASSGPIPMQCENSKAFLYNSVQAIGD